MPLLGTTSARITTLVILGTAVLVGALTVLNVYFVRQDLRKSAGKHVYAQISRAAENIDNRIHYRISALQAATEGLSVKAGESLTEKQVDDFIRGAPILRGMFDNVIVATADARVIADWPPIPGRRGLDVADREYYIATRDNLGPFVSEPFKTKVGQKMVISFAVPIVRTDGSYAGLINATLDLMSNDFIAEIRRARIGEDGHYEIVSKRRITIVHPDAGRMMTPIPSAQQNPNLHRALDGWKGWAEGTISTGERMVLAYVPLKNAPWVVGGFLPVQEAYAPLQRIESVMLLAGSMAAIALALLTYFSVAWSLRPLRILRRQIEDLRKGVRIGKVDVTGTSDLRALSEMVNEFTDSRERMQEILRQREAFFRALTDNSPHGIFVVDASGRCTYMNRCHEEQIGRRSSEMTGNDWCSVVHPGDADTVRREWMAALSSGEPYRSEHRVVRLNGTLIWVRVDMVSLSGTQADEAYLGVVTDITARREAMHLLLEEKERAQTILAAMQEAVIIADDKGRVSQLNPAAEQLLAINEAELVGTPLGVALRFFDEAAGKQVEVPEMMREKKLVADTWVLEHGSRPKLPVEVAWYHFSNADTRGGGVLVIRDVTQRRQKVQRIAWEATHDALTGLPNRRAFDEAFDNLLVRFQRDQTPCCLVVIDLDYFKNVNDNGGHELGDECLRQVSDLIRNTVRSSDMPARIGGDEFAILLSGCTRERAVLIATALREGIAALQLKHDKKTFVITTSIGFTVFMPGDTSCEQIMKRADTACYRAKAGGRNAVEIEPAEAAPTEHGTLRAWVASIMN